LAVTLPLTADAIYTLIRRFIRQENIFKGHRSHLYQRLQQSGWTHRQVTLTYLIATSIIVLFITTLGTLGSWFSLVGVLMAIAIAEMYLQAKRAIV